MQDCSTFITQSYLSTPPQPNSTLKAPIRLPVSPSDSPTDGNHTREAYSPLFAKTNTVLEYLPKDYAYRIFECTHCGCLYRSHERFELVCPLWLLNVDQMPCEECSPVSGIRVCHCVFVPKPIPCAVIQKPIKGFKVIRAHVG